VSLLIFLVGTEHGMGCSWITTAYLLTWLQVASSTKEHQNPECK
jgi:hypothetical protein